MLGIHGGAVPIITDPPWFQSLPSWLSKRHLKRIHRLHDDRLALIIEALDYLKNLPTSQDFPYHLNLPDVPNDAVEYRGWVPDLLCELVSVCVYMGTANTQGNYTLDVINEDTGNSCLSGGVPFGMNTVAADTVTTVPLNASSGALDFPARGRWTVLLTSDDINFDGSDIYVELVFRG